MMDRQSAQGHARQIVAKAIRGHMERRDFLIFLGQELSKIRQNPSGQLVQKAFLFYCRENGLDPRTVSIDVKTEFMKHFKNGYVQVGDEIAGYVESYALKLYEVSMESLNR